MIQKENQTKHGQIKTEFYNRSMKSFLQNNNVEMYLTYNQGKSFVAEKFVITLKTQIHDFNIKKYLF